MTHNSSMNPQRWSLTTKRIVVVILLALAILLFLHTGDIVLPFVWAGILAYILMPLVNVLERKGLPRNLAATAVFLGVFALIIGIGRFAIPLAFGELRDLQRSLPRLLETAQASVASFTDGTILGGLDSSAFQRGLAGILDNVSRMAVPFVVAFGRFLLEFLVFLIGLFFLLRDAPKLKHWARHLIPPSQRPDLLPLLGQVSALLGHYVRGQILLILIMATLTTVSLTLFGVPYSFVLGLLTGVLETIPIVGPITAGAIAVIVALGHENPFGWSQVVYGAAIAGLFTVLRHLEDYFVIPLVIGRIVRLHPAIVIFSLLAGGAVAGLLGVLLAVPVAATTRLVLIFVNAKLRDEDPYPRIENELAAASEDSSEAPRGTRPIEGPVRL